MLAATVGAVTGTATYGVGFERHRLGVTQANLPVAGLPAALEGVRIALLTDIHHSALVGAEDIQNAVALALAQRPDLIVLGSDYYESKGSIDENEARGHPRIGIGANTRVEEAIIDKNARIGNNVTISPKGKPENVDHPMYYIRDGIVIIPKNAVVPHGTVI